MTNATFLNQTLRNDNIFVQTEAVELSSLTGLPSRKGLGRAIISEGKIVNVVSSNYCHLPNEAIFLKVEEKLIEADVNYDMRSINRSNQSFSVDYILNDDRYAINVKKGLDIIKPMLRFTNSYDGSCKTSGHFGFYRKVCTNGLHVAQTEIGFSVKHRPSMSEVILPQMDLLIQKFMSNEYYSLHQKFEVLAERQIVDLEKFVKFVADKTKMFVFETSAKNPAPSVHARRIIEIVNQEAQLLGTEPNFWLGYNAFNSVLHNDLKKSFQNQYNFDESVFETIASIN